MTISYHIDHSQRIIFVHMADTITNADLLHFTIDLWQLPQREAFATLVDTRDVTSFAVTSVGLQRLATTVNRLKPPAAPIHAAIVACADLVYGMGRMYETMQSRTTTILVFREYADALYWLRQVHCTLLNGQQRSK